MSAFLGPIHFWLYHKVQLQEQLTEALLEAFPAQQDRLKATLDEEYGELPSGELRDIIDESNIHGWLQAQVSRVEQRLSYAASHLAVDNASKEALLRAAVSAGQAAKLTASTPEEAFQALQDVLLDGMPCDHVNAMCPGTENGVCWERVNDLHGSYYTALDADPALFDEIRDAWVHGMLAETGLTYQRSGMIFSIVKANDKAQ